MPHKPKPDSIQAKTTPANATPGSVWALMTGADPEKLAQWDYHHEHMVGFIAEAMATGAAVTFGAKRDLSGMSVRVFANGAVVLQAYFDNVFDLNETIEGWYHKLRTVRLAEESKGGAAS